MVRNDIKSTFFTRVINHETIHKQPKVQRDKNIKRENLKIKSMSFEEFLSNVQLHVLCVICGKCRLFKKKKIHVPL